MKTIPTIIFAIAVMAFVFDANPAMAKEADCPEGQVPGLFKACVPKKYDPSEERFYGEMDGLEDPGNEKDVADSGEEGSTSAAESDQ